MLASKWFERTCALRAEVRGLLKSAQGDVGNVRAMEIVSELRAMRALMASGQVEGIRLVSSNPRKLEEFRRFGMGIEVAAGHDIVEAHAESEMVAVYKAIAAGAGSLVEDTILVIDGEEFVDIKWHVENLDGAEECRWVTTLAFNDGEAVRLYRGEVRGHLVRPVRVPADAFGFDPWFVPCGADARTLYELEAEGRKDLYSARYRAVEALLSGNLFSEHAVDAVPAWQGAWQAAPPLDAQVERFQRETADEFYAQLGRVHGNIMKR